MATTIIGPREMDLRARARMAVEALGPDRGAFLRAICENPPDRAPRLVYADWLDERATADARGTSKDRKPGNGFAELAKLIRVQCADPKTMDQLLVSRLLKADIGRTNRRQAWGPFPPTVALPVIWQGFPRVVTVGSLAHALRWAEAIGRWLPVDRVSVTDRFPLDTGGYLAFIDGGFLVRDPARPPTYVWQENADWYRGTYPTYHERLPPEVFRWLIRPKDQVVGGGFNLAGRRAAGYATMGEAEHHLACALADYCRHAAGLPPLHWNAEGRPPALAEPF